MTTAAFSPKFELLGINDDESSCQCCGKQGLKAVYWLEDKTTGQISHVGTTCGPRLLCCSVPEFKVFEKAEKVRHQKEAQAWFSAQKSVRVYCATLEELNAKKEGFWNGKMRERMAIMQPLSDAMHKDETEARKRWPLAVALYAI